jgi:antitoxin MazE
MKQRVKMWGNSLSVRIPKALAEETGLRSGSEIEVFVKEAKLIIEPIVRPAYNLHELLAQVSVENLHTEI